MLEKLVFVTSLFVLAAASSASAQPVPPIRIFDPELFESKIRKDLASWPNAVVGYQVAVVQGGQIVADFAGGKADLEGGRNMTTSHLLNIGSTVKFVTGTLFLRLVDQESAGTPDPSAERQRLLDQKVWDYFPAAFRTSAHGSLAHLTFSDLLTHRSNFESRSHKPWKYLPEGIERKQRDLRKRNYQNANYSLLGYLIPLFDQPSLKDIVDVACTSNVRCAARLLGGLYEELIRVKLREAIEPTLPGSCRGQDPGLQALVAKNYSSPGQPRRGARHDSYRGIGHCHGDGGWLYSARSLARLLIQLETHPDFVDTDFYDSWVDPRTRKEDSEWLVWFFATPSPYFQQRLQWTELPTQPGDHGFENDQGLVVRAHSVIVMLPYNYYAIAIVNSSNNTGNLNSAVLAVLLEKRFTETFDPSRVGG